MLGLKKLHDLLVLRITQPDKEKKTFPLVQIVRRTGIMWEPEVPVDKGWIDIYVPIQKGIKQPYVIEVETGYDFNCSGILQKFERFIKALSKTRSYVNRERGVLVLRERVYPKLFVVIPPDFAEFIQSHFEPKEISVFLWEGTLDWKCRSCGAIISRAGPWKPMSCDSCHKPNRSLYLVDLRDFKIEEAD